MNNYNQPGQNTSRSGNPNQDATGSSGGVSQQKAAQVKDAASSQIDKISQQASSAREQAATRVRRFSSAIKAAGDGVRSDDPWVAEYAEKASRSIEDVATYLTSADPQRLMRDTQQLARRQPAVFFGGAFLLGLAAARFVKSSQSNVERSYREPDYYPREDLYPRESLGTGAGYGERYREGYTGGAGYAGSSTPSNGITSNGVTGNGITSNGITQAGQGTPRSPSTTRTPGGTGSGGVGNGGDL